MINLLFERLPDTIKIGQQDYKIDTNFYRWIALNEMLLDPQATALVLNNYLRVLFTDKIPPFNKETLESVAGFLAGYHANEKKVKNANGVPKSRYVFSFTYDSDYVIGAFQECYGIDLINIDYLHWWHFLALFSALNPECELMRRITLRSTKLSDIPDKKQRNRIRKQQQAIALPAVEMTDESIGAVLG